MLCGANTAQLWLSYIPFFNNKKAKAYENFLTNRFVKENFLFQVCKESGKYSIGYTYAFRYFSFCND